MGYVDWVVLNAVVGWLSLLVGCVGGLVVGLVVAGLWFGDLMCLVVRASFCFYDCTW